MKAGVRALGVAESYRTQTSTLAGAVVRASRVVDDFVFGTCTVGGTDATATVSTLFDRLDRPDVQYVLVAGIAPAWFNVVDLHALADATDRPVLAVSFEESDGLTDSIREAFDGRAAKRRLATYRAQPDRQRVSVGDDTVFVRSVGVPDDEAAEVVRAFTPTGGRPEPLRVARLAARAADQFRRDRLPDEGQ
ncbi:DUF99 family protein [Salinibaculum rarum]|uniref:endonuclease dU n=1 Tax=Salinibaculum rarum TaxID=3058903 RepID=UPI00265D71B6|nr:DUF99 family protein [Salinibaculum sp. KK48]